MNRSSSSVRILRRTALALALSLGSSALVAAPFDQPDANFAGRIGAAGVVLPGSEATLNGRGFTPGQQVTLSSGGQVLNNEAYVADDKGGFQAKVQVPANAVPGRHPIVVEAAGPLAASIFELKVSPDVALSGEDRYTLTSEPLTRGLYQVVYSPKANALFVTSAVGRPPVKESKLLRVDPKTLAVTASVDMAEVPGRDDGHRFAVYGIGIDDARGNVWVTNTRDNTVAVYNQDLKLVKQFEPGLVSHSRDIVVDEQRGKAYASAAFTDQIEVFDAVNPAHKSSIQIASTQRGEDFGLMSLVLDQAGGKLIANSGSTNEIAIIDTNTDAVEKVIVVDGIYSGSGVAYDPKTKRAFVAAQGSDNVAVVDTVEGKTLKVVPVGASALNIVFDPVSNQVYTSNRGAGTTTVLDVDGNIVANLPIGTFPNHAAADGKGGVFVVNKSAGQDDPRGDRVTHIVPKR